MHAVIRLSITSLDGAGGWLVAQNHPNSTNNPGAWTRIEWTDFGSQLVPFGILVADAATEALALAAGPADVTDEWGGCNGGAADQAAAELATPADATGPMTAGCNGGPWRLLTPQ